MNPFRALRCLLSFRHDWEVRRRFSPLFADELVPEEIAVWEKRCRRCGKREELKRAADETADSEESGEGKQG